MPYPNEHAARLRDPGLFVRIRQLWTHGGIRAIGGPLKSNPSGPTVEESIRFDKTKFTPEEARKWLAKNNYKPISFEKAVEAQALTASDYGDPEINPLIPRPYPTDEGEDQ